MGVVYRARDTHLGRMVAIKCLSARLFTDPASKQRFFHECRAASSLNHPNIITIYELINEDGSDYLVMEYVNGKTLEQILSSKRFSVGELLGAAVQISDALATSHASGIIHRDIKPSNVMIAGDRRIKVLDFGLAKIFDQTSETDESSRTKLDQTAEGIAIGTASYMSPEQAEGRALDARTDIFALGALMYEMCTGQRAFAGESRVSTLAAVLTCQPVPIEEIAPNTPKDLQRVILRCLQKDPKRRFQSMLDLNLTLEELKGDSDSGQLSRSPAQTASRRSSWVPTAIAGGIAVALALTAGAWFWRRSEHAPIRQPLALEQLTFDSGLTTNPTIALDGKLIAYASDRAGEGSLDIWVQYRGGEPLRITRDPTDEDEPSFSPDGTKIAYASRKAGGGIYIVSSLGGQIPRQIANFGNRPQFSPDGSQVLFVRGSLPDLSRVFRINLDEPGTAPVELAPNLLSSYMPLWSPDGKYILFLGAHLKGKNAEFRAWIMSASGGTPEPVTITSDAFVPDNATFESLNAWLPGDRIIGGMEIHGQPHLFEAHLKRSPWRLDRMEQITFGTGAVQHPSVAADGTMVVSNEQVDLDLWSLPLDVHRGIVSDEAKRLTQDASRENFPTISVDGTKLSYRTELAGNTQIWFQELPSGAKRPLTPLSRGLSREAVSADGSQVAFHDWSHNAAPSLRWMSTSGNGSSAMPAESPTCVWDWTPDGRGLLVMSHIGPVFTVNQIDLVTRKTSLFLRRPHHVFQTHISHDGRWAIGQELGIGVLITQYDSNHPEQNQWRLLGLPQADLIRWSADDNTIYFVSGSDSFQCVWGQRLDPVTKQLRGSPFAVAHFHQARRSINVQDSGEIGLAVARDKIVLAEAERTGNVWLGKLQ